jgi:ATP-dependent Clp protease adapter protein ClpS
MSTVTIERPKIHEEVDQSIARTWSLIAHNDDVTPVNLVVLAFITVGIPMDEAKSKVIKIHNEGSAVVKSGLSKDTAVEMKDTIVEVTRYNGRFPGIAVDLFEDM